MNLEIYTDGTDYYIRPSGSPATLRWYRQGEHWACARGEMPTGARTVDFGGLPGDLQEEIMAFVARSEVMGSQIWGVSD